MRQSGHWKGDPINLEILIGLLLERFVGIDFKKAANEVRVFIPDPRELELWSPSFFNDLAKRIGKRMSSLCAGSQMARIEEFWRNTPAATTHALCVAATAHQSIRGELPST
jgi:hypothetical protein